MIGLFSKQAIVYRAIASLCETRAIEPSFRDVCFTSKISPKKTGVILERLIEKGFVKQSRVGAFIALEPTHERVIREVCETLSVSRIEVLGPLKGLAALRARRVIAKRLSQDFNYSYSEIGRVLCRHFSTIRDYFHVEQALRRSKKRAERLYGRAA